MPSLTASNLKFELKSVYQNTIAHSNPLKLPQISGECTVCCAQSCFKPTCKIVGPAGITGDLDIRLPNCCT